MIPALSRNCLLTYLDAGGTLMGPEMVYGHWWHQFLHNQTALRVKAALLFRPGTVVVNVPYHLAEGIDEKGGVDKVGAGQP